MDDEKLFATFHPVSVKGDRNSTRRVPRSTTVPRTGPTSRTRAVSILGAVDRDSSSKFAVSFESPGFARDTPAIYVHGFSNVSNVSPLFDTRPGRTSPYSEPRYVAFVRKGARIFDESPGRINNESTLPCVTETRRVRGSFERKSVTRGVFSRRWPLTPARENFQAGGSRSRGAVVIYANA